MISSGVGGVNSGILLPLLLVLCGTATLVSVGRPCSKLGLGFSVAVARLVNSNGVGNPRLVRGRNPLVLGLASFGVLVDLSGRGVYDNTDLRLSGLRERGVVLFAADLPSIKPVCGVACSRVADESLTRGVWCGVEDTRVASMMGKVCWAGTIVPCICPTSVTLEVGAILALRLGRSFKSVGGDGSSSGCSDLCFCLAGSSRCTLASIV